MSSSGVADAMMGDDEVAAKDLSKKLFAAAAAAPARGKFAHASGPSHPSPSLFLEPACYVARRRRMRNVVVRS